MSILKDLPELIKAGVLTQETADRIQEYYRSKSGSSANRLVVVFGALGAILVGLGIILIIAHNWDELSRGLKIFLAFLPLLAGQVLCGYVLIKRADSVTWTESSAVFLFFAVGEAISLVSQIYNIPGDIATFMLTWMLLCLPLIYVMKSSITSLLYICGITFYAAYAGYWFNSSSEPNLYWLLLLAALPYYYLLYRRKPESNFMIFHNWVVPVSVIISLGTVGESTGKLLFIAYFSLFGLLYLIGHSDLFNGQKVRNNGYKILGAFGTMVLLLALSFDGFWEELRVDNLQLGEILSTPEFFASLIISLLAALVLYLQYRKRSGDDIKPLSWIFALFIVTFIVGVSSPLAVVLINLYVLAIGILTIRDGTRQDHLGILNYGLLIITALVICRFFDTDLSFVSRGILFLSIGAGFFAANYTMLKRRKANE